MSDIQQIKSKIKGKTLYHKICVFCLKEVEYYHGKKPVQCPHCGSKDYIKPPTETKLFALQKYWLETKDKKYLEQIYIILIEYAKSIIKKNLPKDFRYHFDQIEEKAQDATTLFIEYYLSGKHGSFSILNSFGGYLQWKVKQVLFNKKNQMEDKHESLNVTIENSQKELLSMSETLNFRLPYGGEERDEFLTEMEDSWEDLADGVQNIIDTVFHYLVEEYSYNTALLVLIGVTLHIEKKSPEYLNAYYHNFGSSIKELVDKVLLFIYRFIKERE